MRRAIEEHQACQAQNNLQAATESIAMLNAEKAVLCQEVATITAEKEKLAEEMEKRSAMADPVKVLKKELVRLRSKLADAQIENTELMGLQGEFCSCCTVDCVVLQSKYPSNIVRQLQTAARLDETDKCLSTVLSEKNQLKAALGEQFSFELNESRSTDSSTSSARLSKQRPRRHPVKHATSPTPQRTNGANHIQHHIVPQGCQDFARKANQAHCNAREGKAALRRTSSQAS
jgi:ribosomal protein L29